MITTLGCFTTIRSIADLKPSTQPPEDQARSFGGCLNEQLLLVKAGLLPVLFHTIGLCEKIPLL